MSSAPQAPPFVLYVGVTYFCPVCGQRGFTSQEAERYHPFPPPHTKPCSYGTREKDKEPCLSKRPLHPDLPADS
jgi:hypothetical protein